nr:MAG TPA: hypothetical protein [Caudoviricetes sp.]
MSAKDATPQEIQAMKARLAKRQEERQFDRDANEAIRMVHQRLPVVVEERMTPTGKARICEPRDSGWEGVQRFGGGVPAGKGIH